MSETPRPLTADEIREAIRDLPAHRADLRDGLRNTLSYVERGIPIKTNAPQWVQAQNVIFVSKVDVELDSDGRADD